MVSGSGWPTKDRSRPRKMTADFDSTCPDCGELIEVGDTIYWSEFHGRYVCSVGCQ